MTIDAMKSERMREASASLRARQREPSKVRAQPVERAACDALETLLGVVALCWFFGMIMMIAAAVGTL
jgi:hypothetical protein